MVVFHGTEASHVKVFVFLVLLVVVVVLVVVMHTHLPTPPPTHPLHTFSKSSPPSLACTCSPTSTPCVTGTWVYGKPLVGSCTKYKLGASSSCCCCSDDGVDSKNTMLSSPLFLYLCTRVCVCMNMYLHVCVYAYTYVCLYVCVYVCMYIIQHLHMTCTFTCVMYMHVCHKHYHTHTIPIYTQIPNTPTCIVKGALAHTQPAYI